ncbi:MAG: DUF2569 domain-containing protein [Enterobacterales bacterium]|nr:DUF2569 domain-containing protein [Enterobacterales bacterium]
MTNSDNLKGLGGWLILVGIGVVISPIRLLIEFIPLYTEIFTEGHYELLTTPGTEVYDVLWAPFIIGELVFNAAMVIATIYLIYLYFSKHYLFPKVYIGIILASLIFIPFDAWVGSFVIEGEPMFTPDIIKELVRSAISALVWIPYMLSSVRVDQTFVEHRPVRVGRSLGEDAVMMAAASSRNQ